MQRPRALIGLAALCALAAPLPALQEPKLGSAWYEDGVDLGFRVRAPRDWTFVPGSPLEPNVVGTYAAENGQYVNLGKEAFVMVKVYLVKFDRREKQGVHLAGQEDLDSWMTRALDEGQKWRCIEEEKPLKGTALEARYAIYEGVSNRGRQETESQPVRAYAARFTLSPQVDVAVVGTGPGDKKKWRTFESAYQAIAKTLQPLEVVASSDEVGKDPRSQKKKQLEDEVARSPGWSLFETPNYFILSSYDDKGFIEELKARLEAMRTIYEKDFPPELGRKIKARPEPPEGEDEPASEDEPPEAPEIDPGQTFGVIDPLMLGKCSVVRVCKNREQYLQYGGNPESSGYFSPLEKELVVFDDKADQGRDYTWGVLSHEGFHQYTFAFFGNLAPHSWFNEGTGDYYFGFDYNPKTKKFKEQKSKGRQDNLLLIREDYVPMREFVRWTKSQYYASPPSPGKSGKPMAGWACYAEGWSLIWFLRTGEAGHAKGWRKEWGSILGTYTDTLLETGDLNQAVDKAFAGVDWDAFEASWAAYSM